MENYLDQVLKTKGCIDKIDFLTIKKEKSIAY